MEADISPFVALICTVVPCLVVIGLIGAGIVFFVKRRKKVSPAPVGLTGIDEPVPPPSPAAVVEPVSVPASPVEPAAEQPVDLPAAPVLPQAKIPAIQPGASILSPSEVVVLRAEAFAPAAGMMNSWRVINTDTKVAGPPLAQNMVATAFLALENAGSIRLEVGKKKATLGLREVDTVYAVPEGQPQAWPAYSYEAGIVSSAASMLASGRNNVQQIVFVLLEEEAGLVWDWAIRLAHRGMAQRGVLGSTVKKGLLGSGLAVYNVPPETLVAAAGADTAALQRLLEDCQKNRPDLWKLLIKEIKQGFDARNESPDMD